MKKLGILLCLVLILTITAIPTLAEDNEVSFEGISLVLDGAIGVKAYFDIDDTRIDIDDTTFYVSTSATQPQKKYELTYDEEKDLYYSVIYVAPKDVNRTTFNTSLQYVIDGSAKALNFEGFKIPTYFEVFKDLAAQDPESKYAIGLPLVNSIEEYANYAESYFYNLSDNLEDVVVDENSINDIKPYKITGTLEGIEYYGTSLILDDTLTIRHYFKVTDKNVENVFKFNEKILEPLYTNDGNYLYVGIENIAAQDIDELYSLNVGDDFKIRYSALNYIKDIQGTDDVKLLNLANALFKYFSEANKYTNEVLSELLAMGSVDLNGGILTETVEIQTGGSIKAEVPQNVEIEENAEKLTLSVVAMNDSDSDVELGTTESVLALDVHIEGISENNTVPITVDLGPVIAPGLNSNSIRLYHVEDGQSNIMTRVANNEEFTAHNQFKYDPETGNLVLYLATFSEVTTITDTVNAWEGAIDTTWYDNVIKNDENATHFTISNADQFAALGQLVCDGLTFSGKTITLTNDVNMGGEGYRLNDKLQFYPIGFNSNGCQNSFEGIFDGAGHKISNVRQNTWDMLGTYDGTYYNAGMGVFGYIKNATIKNLTIDNFSCECEFGTAGVVANCADGVCYFENIAIINCKPYTYNNNCAGILATDGGDSGNEFYFKNITVDNSNTIGALWGTWDGICSGIMCSLKAETKVYMENCHVAAKLDVYNDVCGNYQYYWYRYSGMLIGRVRNTIKWNGYDCPDLKNVTAKNCTVNFGDWNDYYYCEMVANTIASYTHDHQMSRLVKVQSVDGNTVTHLDGTIETIVDSDPNSLNNYRNFVFVPNAENPEEAYCYHFKDGVPYNHTEAGYETTDIDGDGDIDDDVLKEDKQHVYLPFNQLFTGTGWGIRGINLKDLGIDGITIEGQVDVEEGEEESVTKFEAKMPDASDIYNEATYKVGDLFSDVAPENIPVSSSSVVVSITAIETDEIVGTFVADENDWTNGTIQFNEDFTGAVKLTIQDFQFCVPTELYLTVVEAQWITVTFDAAGGDCGDNTVTNIRGAVITLPTPTMTGNAFVGWYASNGDLVGNGGESYTLEADVTLTAKWEPVLYTITYVDGNVNSYSSKPVSAYYGDKVTISVKYNNILVNNPDLIGDSETSYTVESSGSGTEYTYTFTMPAENVTITIECLTFDDDEADIIVW